MAVSRLGAIAIEAATGGNPTKNLGALSTEVLTNSPGAPVKKLGALSAEVVTNAAGQGGGIPDKRLGAISIEVLVPTKFRFVGWGTLV